ncbi:hypothetical protein IJJ08_00150 [bacterium]|nr:hypothetical protein [bacterium]
MTPRIIAIDGGGSKTDYLLADLEGHVVRTLTGGPTSVSANNLGQAGYNLREGIHQLLENETETTVKIATIAVAGLDTRKDMTSAEKVFGEVLSDWSLERLTLVNDSVAALVNGTTRRPALVLIAGTGTNCFGWTTTGRTHRVSGLDYLLSDEGSGYDAGRLAIKAAVRSFDGRSPQTSLQRVVFEHFEVETAGQLKDEIYSPQITKDEVAALAQSVIQQARGGDRTAQQILEYCLGQLIVNVQTVARKLQIESQEFGLVIAGNFLLALEPQFRHFLEQTHLHAYVINPGTQPVYGSLTIAQKLLAGAPIDDYQILA